MKRIGRNKRGSIQDLFYLAFALFAFSLIMLVSYKVVEGVNTQFQAHADIDSHGKSASNQITDMFPGVFDNSFLFLVIVLAILALAFAALVRVHPIFFVPYTILLVIIIFLCGVFSNVFQEVAGHPDFIILSDKLVFTSHIMEYLPLIVGVIGTILAIVMYKLWSSGQ